MGRQDAGDRIAAALVALAALICLANGLAMVAAPIDWYGGVPGVSLTGPPNTHFIRDIGMAYLVSGLLLALAGRDLRDHWRGALVGAAWLCAHGLVHVYELATGVCAPGQFARDAPGVLGPPLLALAGVLIVFARRRVSPVGLPAFVAVPAIEAATSERGGYWRDLRAAPGGVLAKFLGFVAAASHRHAAPPALLHAARIGSVLVEDCGACALICARAAVADGIPRETVNALLAGQPDAGAETAYCFGAAIATQSAEASELGDAIEQAHGRAVRTELALAASLARGFPGLKRGLGLARSCSLTPLHV